MITYVDPVDGQSGVLATITNAVGWMISSNTIVYSNCFSGISASLLYRNTLQGLESELLLHERPPNPVKVGFSAKTRLQLVTALESEASKFSSTDRVVGGEKEPLLRSQMREPDLIDSTLDFGTMRMGRAFAFPTHSGGAQPTLKVPVAKRLETIEGRSVLLETRQLLD